MEQHGTVVLTDAQTGRFAPRVGDGSHVLAEQLDVQPLRFGESLAGELETVGTETLTDTDTSARVGVYILAYGLSREAVEQELG